ncbi:TauD/TfdA family dioxygenase [Roseibium sp. Sym1]|uniref:TauD/TfdA family dioxygenase n=1 Tax=Roseibium sp. Sym1 TaxID=3016006 RepID=UPI0022B59596|nr:TauD/TfdA family dioxygenase [Roseibium sp. Sym1]
MSYLKKTDYADRSSTLAQIRANAAVNAHALLFTEFPVDDDDLLLELANDLGQMSREGIDTRSNKLSKDIIHLVTDHKSKVCDPFGNQITSTTSRELDLHSDEYFSEEPSSIVLLACVTQAARGGESFVVSVDAIAEALPAECKAMLMENPVPTHIGPRHVLTQTPDGLEIRYNRLEMERAQALVDCAPLSPEMNDAIDTLEDCARAHLEFFHLAPGDLLVLNNRKSLHGRTAFSENDNRVLKRIRIK